MNVTEFLDRQVVTRNSIVAVVVAVLTLVSYAADAHAQSGQRAFGQATVEPAINDANGSTVFLLTPAKAPFPSKANPVATAPMYLPVYPTTSTVDPSTLNCQPFNCDHVNVVPFPAPGYANGDGTCLNYGFAAGACALVSGHDHLIGVAPTGDFNVAWHVFLVVFTQKGFDDGAVNTRMLTLEALTEAMAKGDVYPPIDSGITFNCSIVSPVVYFKATPLGGF